MYSNSDSSNGYHNQHQRLGTTHRERVRRGPRVARSRDSRDGVRVSADPLQEIAPCTDFDMAYFHSYAHVGIHEEMIKVLASIAFHFAFCLLLTVYFDCIVTGGCRNGCWIKIFLFVNSFFHLDMQWEDF